MGFAKIVGSLAKGPVSRLLQQEQARVELATIAEAALSAAVSAQLPSDVAAVEREGVVRSLLELLAQASLELQPDESPLELLVRAVSEVIDAGHAPIEIGSDYEPTSTFQAIGDGVSINAEAVASTFQEELVRRIRTRASGDPASPLKSFAEQLSFDLVEHQVRLHGERVESRLLGLETLIASMAHFLSTHGVSFRGDLWSSPVAAIERQGFSPAELLVAELGDLSSAGESAPDRVHQLNRLLQRLDELLTHLDQDSFFEWASTRDAASQVDEDYGRLVLERYRLAQGLRYELASYRGVSSESSNHAVTDLPLDTVFVTPKLLAEDKESVHRTTEVELARRLLVGEDYSELVFIAEELRNLQAKQWQAISEGDEVVDALIELREHRHVVIRGVPGSGKSTLTRFLTRAAVLGSTNESTSLDWLDGLCPIRVELAAFAHWRRSPGNRQRPLRDYIDEDLGEAAVVVGAELRAGRALVLLDGMDEEPIERLRIELAARIDDFIRDHSENRIVVTSRPIGYQRLTGALPHYDLAPLDDAQMEEFARAWQRARLPFDPERAEREAKRDIAEIRRSPRIVALGRRPLIMVLLLFRRFDNVRLPDQRAKLYEQLVHTLVERWTAARSEVAVDEAITLQANELVPLLAQVAFKVHRDHPSGRVSHQELVELLASAIEDHELEVQSPRATATAYVQALTDRSGLLEESAAGFISFWHLTFEEYLAGIYLANPDNAIESDKHSQLVEELCLELAWQETFVLATGYLGHVKNLPNQAQNFLRLIQTVEAPSEQVQTRRAKLIAEVLADGPGLKPSATRSFAAFVIDELVRLPSFTTGYAFCRLVQANRQLLVPEASVSKLSTIARSPSWTIRLNALRLLGNVSGVYDEAKAACLGALIDADSDVAFHAWLGAGAAALGEVPRLFSSGFVDLSFEDSPYKIEALVGLLAHADMETRLQAAEVLIRLDGDAQQRGIGALVDLLAHAYVETRMRAAQVLRQLDGDALASRIPALVGLLTHADVDTRLRAAEVLVRLDGDAQQRGIEALVDLLTHAKLTTRMRAAGVLGRLDGDALASRIPALVGLLTHADVDIRRRAAEVLVRLGGDAQQRGIGVLVDLLAHADIDTRLRAAEVLVGLDDDAQERGIGVLVGLLTHADVGTRLRAAEVLVRLGGDAQQRGIGVLVDLLAHADVDTRLGAAGALGQLDGDALASRIPALVGLLTHADVDIRRRAAEVLVRLGGDAQQRGIGGVVDLLAHADIDTRLWAAEVLVGLDDDAQERGIGVLVDLLAHADVDVRLRAAQALVRLGGDAQQRGIGVLVDLLAHTDVDTRLWAAQALVRLDDDAQQRGIGVLVDLLTHAKVTTRRRAAQVLIGLNGDALASHVPALVDLLAHTDDDTRTWVAEVLKRLDGDALASHVPALVDLLAHTDDYTRWSAAEALSLLSTPDAELAGELSC